MTGGGTGEFEISPTSNPLTDAERAAMLVDPGFGRVFTEHMVTIRYAAGKGWYDARLEPFGPLPLSPAAAVLHYAQEIFEGLKAYALDDGGVALFRPQENARRFQRSAERMAMAPLPEELFLESLRLLVRQDRAWVPTAEGSSLYVRPFMIATEVFLGVRPSTEYLFSVIASPVGAYFQGGVKPTTIWLSRDFTRAAPGGTGAAKCGGNYATSLLPQSEAMDHGCDQVVFLDAAERRWVEELGGMNVFFVYGEGDDTTLVTPPLGTILDGITRSSVMTLAEHLGYRVEERPYSVDEWRADARSGRLREAFACGTAAVITPIGRVRSADEEFTINGGEAGKVTMDLRQRLLDIQYCRAEDTFGWVERI